MFKIVIYPEIAFDIDSDSFIWRCKIYTNFWGIFFWTYFHMKDGWNGNFYTYSQEELGFVFQIKKVIDSCERS